MTGTMSRLAVAVVLVCVCAVEGFAPMAAPAGGRHGSAARAIPALRVPRSGQASAARSQVVMQVELFGSQGSRSPLVRPRSCPRLHALHLQHAPLRIQNIVLSFSFYYVGR